ncbi:MAG TPA: hypothetical protein VM032_19585 [Vicinamibacterales bacterium]|nr:hypothetical protein [Vicinamibacterales bacterium]
MTIARLALLSTVLTLVASTGCTRTLPEEGPLDATSDKVSVVGEYKRASIDAVDRVSIDDGRLVLHGPSSSVAVDLPANADPEQKNKGWALVTEAEGDETRSLTFTQETSLDDFTVTVPAAAGPIAYGSLGGRDGNDVLLFAYGSGSKAYWGWATITRRAPAAK